MKIFLTPIAKIAVVTILLLPLLTSAGTSTTTNSFGKLDKGFAGTVDAGTSLIDAIRDIVNVLLTLAALVAGIMVVYGGFLYLTSAGDESQAEKGKKTVIYAVIGLIIIGLSAVIVNFTLGAISQ